ncbi:hypothetical protein ACHAQJ_001262 [Trichoderma viride]
MKHSMDQIWAGYEEMTLRKANDEIKQFFTLLDLKALAENQTESDEFVFERAAERFSDLAGKQRLIVGNFDGLEVVSFAEISKAFNACPDSTQLTLRVIQPRRRRNNDNYEHQITSIVDHHVNTRNLLYYVLISQEVSWSSTIHIYIKVLGSGLYLDRQPAKIPLEATLLEAEPQLMTKMSNLDRLCFRPPLSYSPAAYWLPGYDKCSLETMKQ